jgi:hypothetical protein
MKKRTKKQRMPKGWTEERIRKLAEYYDNQTDEEAIAEIEHGVVVAENQTVVARPPPRSAPKTPRRG